MRTFFLQLFLSFWLATLAVFVGATIFFPDDVPHSPTELEAIFKSSAQHTLTIALEDYRSHGCSAVSLSDPLWIVANAQGKPLCGRSITQVEAEALQRSISKDALTGKRNGSQWIHAMPITLASGAKWFIVLSSPFIRPPLFPPFPKSALPLSILVTFLFAYLLTRPLRALSAAFRTFTAGDLDTRLPVPGPSRWGQFDSADVRTLMADFNSMADRVSELIDAQKMLIRDVSHELRSPLARLCMAVELAREDSNADQAVFDHMEQETGKVNELIGEMLTLSLLESTRQTPRLDSFEMQLLIEELLEAANFEASARGCRIEFHSNVRNSLMTGQPVMLSRAIENILRNAIRYTPPGGVVEVELSNLDVHQAMAVQIPPGGFKVSVRDTGPGIPLDHLSHIFRPFYRVDMARSESSGGFGVGLAIAERAVHLHGGKIMASNRSAGGLNVQILLPPSFDNDNHNAEKILRP
ncbi:signal transduction histidine kinase [Terriglobus roseus DSM 18391]|uniref:histidine kinase n=1 Tax=Terriglobus roseus (strain DSM 18391 / NRRL B-41598 / KBS 63) TaxID=926566 RepID=I3ZHF7_TERRK|nr:ATP-binding protein [Terriglobus roseus]AFL88332.1 signal transduction histidine kinase [Terriglobus roseus DSM 18391]AFL88675.1 signal transduction histidine kinase [Terriglobus roseus DSM 18391]